MNSGELQPKPDQAELALDDMRKHPDRRIATSGAFPALFANPELAEKTRRFLKDGNWTAARNIPRGGVR